MEAQQEFQTHQQPSFADLHLLDQSALQDLAFDSRWQNIYVPSSDATTNFDWMHYRQPEDALSSASSSDSNGSYTYSIYSASSEPSNTLHYGLPPSYQQYPDQFAQTTSTLPPSTRHHPDDANAWMYAQQQNNQHHNPNGASPYQSTAADPYHQQHHTSQRDSGDYSSYSSGGEEQLPSQPHQYSLSPASHHHHQQHDQQQQMYMSFGAADLNGNGGGGGASPYAASGHAKDLYTPPPPAAGSAAVAEAGRISSTGSGQSYPSPYPSPSSQQGQPQRGPGGSRLTPVLSQLSIDQMQAYPPSPLSPQGSNNGAGAQSYSSPGPERSHGFPSSSSASSPYGRPAHHGHGHHHRYASHQHSHSQSTSSSIPSSASAASSQQSQQQPQQPQAPQQAPGSAMFSPSGIAGGGRIFASNALPPLGPAPGSESHHHAHHPSSFTSSHHHAGHGHPHQQQPPPQQSAHPLLKPKKEMVAGTPTHPDIPRPAVVAAPVPVPNLTKKSRGRQVPSVNAVGSASAAAGSAAQSIPPAAPRHSRSRERSRRTAPAARGAERLSYEGDNLESPISPSDGSYYAPTNAQWSGDEFGDRFHGHGHRSLFGSDPLSVPPSGNGGPGSTSSMSSPATSLSSRRTVEESAPGPSQQPVARTGPAPGSIEEELRARPFVCTVEGCGKAYIRAEHLKRHVRSIHTNDKPYECPFEGCGREFSRYDNLCQHYKGVHGPTSGALPKQH